MKPNRKRGRPKGSRKRYSFEQTKLGFALKYECPATYEVVMEITKRSGRTKPTIEVITLVFSSSEDPSLGKRKFARYLDEYRRVGLYCGRPKVLTPRRERYYRHIRQKKLQKIRL